MGFYRVSMSIVDSNNRPVEKVTKTVLISDKVKNPFIKQYICVD